MHEATSAADRPETIYVMRLGGAGRRQTAAQNAWRHRPHALCDLLRDPDFKQAAELVANLRRQNARPSHAV